jgi:hypothetical protein
MSTYSEPTAEQAVALFQEIEKRFPHNSVGEDMWYLVTVRTLRDHSTSQLTLTAVRARGCRARTCRNFIYLSYQQTSIQKLRFSKRTCSSSTGRPREEHISARRMQTY